MSRRRTRVADKHGEISYSLKLPEKLVNAMQKECLRRNVCQKTLVRSVLEGYFSPVEDDRWERILGRRINVVEGSCQRLGEQVDVVLESLGLFIEVWLTNTEELGTEEKEARTIVGKRRFSKFVNVLTQRLGERRGIGTEVTGAKGVDVRGR